MEGFGGVDLTEGRRSRRYECNRKISVACGGNHFMYAYHRMNRKTVIFVATGILITLFIAVRLSSSGNGSKGDYYSVQERRMPCGRILRREVVHTGDAWRKTMTLMDAEGRVLETKTRTVEPEHCAAIQAGQFVPGLWRDCTVAI